MSDDGVASPVAALPPSSAPTTSRCSFSTYRRARSTGSMHLSSLKTGSLTRMSAHTAKRGFDAPLADGEPDRNKVYMTG